MALFILILHLAGALKVLEASATAQTDLFGPCVTSESGMRRLSEQEILEGFAAGREYAYNAFVAQLRVRVLPNIRQKATRIGFGVADDAEDIVQQVALKV